MFLQVQALIEQEVCKAVENKEKQIEDIIRHIQKTNDENGYETAIQKLEVGVINLCSF